MTGDPQPFDSPKVPDWQTADAIKRLHALFSDAPDTATRVSTMLKLCAAGVDPSTAAIACAMDAQWDEDEVLRAAVERAYAQHNARVQMNLAKHLTQTSQPNATLMSLHLKAKAGYNEKAGEGWAQEIKLLPTIVHSAAEAARLNRPVAGTDQLMPNDLVLHDGEFDL